LASLGLVALVAATFYPALGFFFAQDDFGWLRLARYQWTSARSVFTTYHGSFTPVANLVIAAGYRLFGLASAPFHAVNLALHLANSFLVAALALRVTGRRDAALAAAAFFATTFSHWEAVMWLAGGMPQLLATFFLLMAVAAGSRWAEGRGTAWVAAAFVLSLLAVLSKETGVVAPLLLIVDFAYRGGAGGGQRITFPQRRLALALTPWLLAWPAYLWFQAYGFRFPRLMASGMYRVSLDGRVVIRALRYMLCLILPDASSPYTAPHFEALSARLYAFLLWAESAALYVLPVALVLLLWRGDRVVRFAILWISVSLLPFVFLTGPLAARYLYLASVAFAVWVGWLFARPAGRGARLASVGLFLLVIAANLGANRLAEHARLANSAVRREIVTVAAAAANETTGPLTVFLAGVPDKYEDVVEGIIVFTRPSVNPVRVAVGAALEPPLAGTVTFVDRHGRLQAPSGPLTGQE
jgi:hypothetical protein